MNKNSLAGYTLILSKQAEKDLIKIERDQVILITKRLENLVNESYLLDIKKMSGEYDYPTYRLRSGDYRIIYQVRKHEVIVLVIKIAHRKDVYRNRGRYD